MRVWAIVGLMTLSGCQFIPGTHDYAIHEAQDAVRYQLTDPAAGQFRNDRITGAADRQIVCGEVNAKNRLGAYAGFRPYAYLVKAKKALVLPELDGSNEAALAVLDFPEGCRS